MAVMRALLVHGLVPTVTTSGASQCVDLLSLILYTLPGIDPGEAYGPLDTD